MTKTYTFGVLVALALVAVPALSSAQSIIGRSTTMQFTSLYGGGPDSWDPSGNLGKTDVVLSDTSTLEFADDRTGTFPLDWTAGVSINMLQTHTITGSLSAFQTIEGSMRSTNTTYATGIGAAGIPGSQEQVITFEIDQLTNYRFEGHVFYPNGGAFKRSIIEMQFFFPWGWSNIFNTALPDLGPDGTFDFTGQMEPGSYRIRNYAELQGAANTTFIANNDYKLTNLDAVPEPASMLGLGAGLAALAARRRRRA